MAEYYGARRSGISWLPVIICAVLFVVVSSFCFYYYHKAGDLTDGSKQLKAKSRTIDDQNGQAVNEISRFNTLAGTEGANVERFGEKIQLPEFPTTGMPDKITVDNAEEVKKKIQFAAQPDILRGLNNLRARITYLQGQRASWKYLVADLNGLLAVEAVEKTQIEGLKSSLPAELDKNVAMLNEVMGKSQGFLKSVQADAAKQQEGLNARLKELSDALNDAKQKRSVDEIKITDQTIELEKKIKEFGKLLAHPSYFTDIPAAHLFSVSTLTKKGRIDVGSRDAVVPGMRFWIYRQGNYGQIIDIGNAEVTRVSEGASECNLVFDSRTPPVEGDPVENPILPGKAGRQVHFVVAGPFSIQGYSDKAVTEVIKRWGGVVDPEVTYYTDYLIADETAAPQLEKARQLNILIIPPNHFVKFISR